MLVLQTTTPITLARKRSLVQLWKVVSSLLCVESSSCHSEILNNILSANDAQIFLSNSAKETTPNQLKGI